MRKGGKSQFSPSYPHPYALTLRIRFKLTASPIVSSSTETRCRRRPCQLNMVVAFAAASFTFLYRTCGAGLRLHRRRNPYSAAAIFYVVNTSSCQPGGNTQTHKTRCTSDAVHS